MKARVTVYFAALVALSLANILGAADVSTNAPPAAPIILTPKPAAASRINGPKIFGVRPGLPFLYSIPATGERPMTFAADNLPDGLHLDPANGRITGSLNMPGEFSVTLRVKNSLGAAEKPFRIVVGEEIQLTPAMGWNSYNCFGERVTQDLALCAARAIIKLGLDQHGWTYVNMDDGWVGRQRNETTHALQADPQRFTDIKGMVDEIHAMGLKAGLYSTPWTETYGGSFPRAGFMRGTSRASRCGTSSSPRRRPTCASQLCSMMSPTVKPTPHEKNNSTMHRPGSFRRHLVPRRRENVH